ncbi:hypothetical protein V7x_31570 [Crateriforma conspicua]|uniref:Uncharacterized protein n=1 Tax=Crateriforma conspicua TaxID=2527996 RepID=A0A5C6FWP2_9PLAN|nr:hypothetical protein V7x_31570 [Crateriforma conspicua]
MRICESLPKPETVARELAVVRRERDLLRRLHRLVIEVREMRAEPDVRERGPSSNTGATAHG